MALFLRKEQKIRMQIRGFLYRCACAQQIMYNEKSAGIPADFYYSSSSDSSEPCLFFVNIMITKIIAIIMAVKGDLSMSDSRTPVIDDEAMPIILRIFFFEIRP